MWRLILWLPTQVCNFVTFLWLLFLLIMLIADCASLILAQLYLCSILSCFVLSGTYYFYASVDDLASVYGRRVVLLPDGTEQFGPEELLVTATYNVNSEGNYWPTCSGCKPARSKGISLLLGERYQLRVRFVNTGGADQIAVAMKIELPGHTEQVAAPRPTAQPVFVNTSQPSMSPTLTVTGAPTRHPTNAPTPVAKPSTNPTRTPTRAPTRAPTARPSVGPTQMPTYLANQGNFSLLPEEIRAQQRVMSNSFLRHHSLKDTQIIALKLPFFYEIQVWNLPFLLCARSEFVCKDNLRQKSFFFYF